MGRNIAFDVKKYAEWEIFMSVNRPVIAEKKENKKSWSNKKTIAAVIIGVAIIAAIIFAILVAVFGLQRVKPIKSTKSEAAVVGECAGYEVKYEELRYVTLLCCAELDEKLGKYDELSAEERAQYENTLKELVVEKIKSNYIVLSLCDEYGIDVGSRKIDNQVQKDIEAFVDESFLGSFDSYKAAIKEMNLTDSLLRFTYKVDYLEELLLEKVVESTDLIKYDEDTIVDFTDYVMTGGDYVRTIHAYYPKRSAHVNTSNSRQRAEATASALASIADDDERYLAMCSAIGEAPFVAGISMTGNGIYFTYGQMGDAYESAAFALEEFGVSDVVETSDGYYVIMRLDLDEQTVKKKAREFLVQYKYVILNSLENAHAEQVTFTPNEYFSSISLIDIE